MLQMNSGIGVGGGIVVDVVIVAGNEASGVVRGVRGVRCFLGFRSGDGGSGIEAASVIRGASSCSFPFLFPFCSPLRSPFSFPSSSSSSSDANSAVVVVVAVAAAAAVTVVLVVGCDSLCRLLFPEAMTSRTLDVRPIFYNLITARVLLLPDFNLFILPTSNNHEVLNSTRQKCCCVFRD